MPIKIKFKVNLRERIYVSTEWISNGHWCVRRSAVQNERLFKEVWNREPGIYQLGYPTQPERDLKTCIPDMGGYHLGEVTNEARINDQSVVGVRLKFTLPGDISGVVEQSLSVWIAPEYLPLLDMGKMYCKGPLNPIVVMDNKEIITAVIMPVRIDE